MSVLYEKILKCYPGKPILFYCLTNNISVTQQKSQFNTGVATNTENSKWCSQQMVQVGLCTLLMMLNKSALFTLIPKDKQLVAKEQIFMLVLKNYFFPLDCLSYWSSLEKAIIFIFNSDRKCSCYQLYFSAEVFKPRTDK